ncbi:MAG TPA: hypothetical protein VGL61_32805 [Kofleriaceae bacterium]|jgi:hypothetical protein
MMNTIELSDLSAVCGGANSGRKPVELLPGSGVTFRESKAEQSCLAKTSKIDTQLTDREIGLKCGFSPARATAYSNAVSNAEDAIDP